MAANTARSAGRVGEWSQYLHHEHGLALPLERPPAFRSEHREYLPVFPEHLRAHAVGDDLEARMGVQALDEIRDRRNVVFRERVQADLDSDVHALLPSESVVDRHTPLARVAEAQVKLVRKIRRFVAEEEAADRVAYVEDVPAPDRRAPALGRVAEAQVHQGVRVRLLVVARVEIEIVLARDVQVREPAAWMLVADRDRVFVLRSARLLPAVEIAVAEQIVDVACTQEPERRPEIPAFGHRPAPRRFEAVVFAARVVGIED